MPFRRLLPIVLLVAAMAPAAWLAWSFGDQPQFGRFHDDTIYVVTAKALASGDGYRILSFPGAPYQTKYPPLYPAMLAVLWKLNPDFPANLAAMAVLAWLSYAAFVIAAYFVFRRMEFCEIESAALAAVVALTPSIAYYSTAVMPDLLFCAMLMTALLLADRAHGAWAGALAGAAFLMKSLALPLAGTVPLLLALEKRWRAAVAFVVPLGAAVVGWLWWTRVHAVSSSDSATLYYTNYIRYHFHIGAAQNQALVIWKNVGAFFAEFGSLLIFELGSTPWGVHVSRLLTFAAMAGVVRMARANRFRQYALFGAAFFVQSLIWHFPPAERFLFPVFPLMVAGLYAEGKNLARMLVAVARTGNTGNRVVATVILPLLMALGWMWVRANSETLFRTLPAINRQHRELIAVMRQDYAWMRANLPAGERVLSYYDPLLYLYTGRESCRLTISTMPFYLENRDQIRAEVRGIAAFARAHGMHYLYWTGGDFHTDLYGDDRDFALDYVSRGAGFRAIHKTRVSMVFELPAD